MNEIEKILWKFRNAEPLEYYIDQALSDICKALEKITPGGEQLHIWYLEAVEKLTPNMYNLKAKKPYDQLTPQQRSIDRYIARKIQKAIERLFK